MEMPEPDSATIARRTEIIDELKRIVPVTSVIAEEEGLRAYECDGVTAYRQLPLIVVLPETTEQISGTWPMSAREISNFRAASACATRVLSKR